jgi:hypothetical protein
MLIKYVLGTVKDFASKSPVSMFEREGFVIAGRPSEKYVVMQREV